MMDLTPGNPLKSLQDGLKNASVFEKLASVGIALDTVGLMLASFASAFDQSARLVKLQIDDASDYDQLLLAQSVEGHEAVSEGYQYDVTCLSPDAFIDIDDLLGHAAKLDILTGAGGGLMDMLNPDSQPQPESVTRCGLITRVQALNPDGGFAKYVLTIESPLALLQHRRTCRVFQDMTVPEIVQSILDEHRHGNAAIGGILKVKFDLQRACPTRSYCIQYREPDLDFIERLLFEEGLAYRWEHHVQDGAQNKSAKPLRPIRPGSPVRETPPSVTLVVFDAYYALPQATQNSIRYHRADATESEDALTQWSEKRKIGPGSVSLSTWDYKLAHVTELGDASMFERDEGAVRVHQAEATLEEFDAPSLYYASSSDELNHYARLRQQARDRAKREYLARGNVRQLRAGEWFSLTGHPLFDKSPAEAREFVASCVDFSANNNLPADLRAFLKPADLEKQAPPPYLVQIRLQHRTDPLTPAYAHTRHAKPTADGIQSAVVVGPRGQEGQSGRGPGSEVYTDSMGRVRVQFHWQRPQEHPGYGANMDERSSCWLRVAYASAGMDWGSQFIPRIGQEVLVDFIEEDIDRPVITAAIHNGEQPNPDFSDAGTLPANRTLSGIKTKEHEGHQYNELLFDDTPGEVRTKLSSEHGKTQINQGFLTHPRQDGAAEPRGEGVELRTDRAIALRGAEGVLISTEPKPAASGTQLDREAALAQLDSARQAVSALSDAAQDQNSDPTETGPKALDVEGEEQDKVAIGHIDHLAEALHSWEAGMNTDPEAKTREDNQPGKQALLMLSGVDGVGIISAQEMALVSGKNLDLVSQRDIQQSTVRRWIENIGKKFSAYVHGIEEKFNLKLVTAKGDAQFIAQSGDIEIVGDQNVGIFANKNKFKASAKEELLMACAGAYIKFKDGNIYLHAPVEVDFKAGTHDFGGPTSMEDVQKSVTVTECSMTAQDASESGGAFSS